MSDAFHSAASPPFKRQFCRTVALLNCLLFATLIAGNANAAAVDVCTPGELAAAVDNAGAGDRIVMCDKTWKDVVIDFGARGTEGASVTLTAETPGAVVLTGSSRIKLSGRYAVIDGLRFEGRYTGPLDTGIIEFKGSGGQCFDCRITNISMVGYSPANESANTKWVVLHGARNRVDHSHFKGKDNMGAMIQVRRDWDNLEPNYDLIDHNFFEDRPEFGGEGNTNGDTIEIGSMGKYSERESRTTFEFNYMRNIDSNYEVITIKSSGNTIRYNVVESSTGVVSLRHGHGNIIHGNFILGRGKEGSGGIRISGSSHVVSSNYISDINPKGSAAFAALRLMSGSDDIVEISGAGASPYYKFERANIIEVVHNTIVDAGANVVFGSDEPLPPKDVALLGNVVLRGKGPAIVDVHMGAGIDIDSNICFGTDGGIGLLGIDLLDPLFNPDTNGIERPSANSPVIDSISEALGGLVKLEGEGSKRPEVDMDGQKRAGFADIGADEVVAGEQARGPLSTCGVGPVSYRIGLSDSCSKAGDGDAPPNPPSSLIVSQ